MDAGHQHGLADHAGSGMDMGGGGDMMDMGGMVRPSLRVSLPESAPRPAGGGGTPRPPRGSGG